MDKTIEYRCPECNKLSELYLWIESHDEFSLDENCGECGAKIPSHIIDKILNDEVTDFVSSKIDYAMDMRGDR